MKNRTYYFTFAAVLAAVILSAGFVQAQTADNPKTHTRIELVCDEGQKTLTVTTIDDNGNETTETYEGDEVDQYLNENDLGIGSMSNESCSFAMSMNDFDFNWEALHHLDSLNEWDEKAFELHLAEMLKHIENMEFEFAFDFDTEMDEFELDMEYIDEYLEQMLSEIPNVMTDVEILTIEEDLDEIERILEEMEIDISVLEEGDKKVIIAKSVIIEHVETEDNGLKADIDFYPNPNSGMFQLEFEVPSDEKAKVTITDLNGKVVYKNTVKGAGAYNMQVDISSESKGTYLLNLQQGNESITKKIVIQ